MNANASRIRTVSPSPLRDEGCTASPTAVQPWAMAFRTQPQRDVIIVDQIPAGPSDPSIDDPTRPRPFRTASSIGVDATKPYGKPFSEVADVPGWEDFEMPELDGR